MARRRSDGAHRPGLGPLRCALLAIVVVAASGAAVWKSLANDGIHDPRSPAIGVLQEPREALSALPPDSAGNQVRWVRALEEGRIRPRTNVRPESIVNLRTTDVLFKRTGEMHMVLFPHRPHTAWLDCSNCHDELFERRAGASKVNMYMILQGEKCGLCHGAVAFPLTECGRCHSVARGSAVAQSFGRELVRESPSP